MGKSAYKQKSRDYGYDEFDDVKDYDKKKSRKKEHRKPKYFDEYESYEASHKFDYKSQKFRY